MRSSKVPEHPPAGSCTSHSRECARAARRLTSVAARTFLRDDLQLGRLVTCATVRDCRQQLVDALKALIELRHLLRVRPGQQRLSNGAWGPRGYCRSAVNVGNQELHPNARPSRGVDCRQGTSWLHRRGSSGRTLWPTGWVPRTAASRKRVRIARRRAALPLTSVARLNAREAIRRTRSLASTPPAAFVIPGRLANDLASTLSVMGLANLGRATYLRSRFETADSIR
jgi:hypothetical protein